MSSIIQVAPVVAVATAAAITFVTGTAMKNPGTAEMSCDILMAEHAGGVQLKGVVIAAKATTGEYRFSISQTGSGGTSVVKQGGEFSVRAGERQIVGEVGLGADQSIDAKLTVTSPAGSASCSRHK